VSAVDGQVERLTSRYAEYGRPSPSERLVGTVSSPSGWERRASPNLNGSLGSRFLLCTAGHFLATHGRACGS